MKFFNISIVYISALTLSGLAAYISIIGMMALFPAAGFTIALVMAALESSKLVGATWLHSYWHNKSVSVVHKAYLGSAVIVLMLITAMGMYGYFAKGYLDQQAPVSTTNLQISLKEQQLGSAKERLKRLGDRQAQLDAAINTLIGQNQVAKSLAFRGQQKAEREQISKDVTTSQAEIDKISADLLPMLISTNNEEVKLGPIKYVADLFGWKNPDAAVRMVILMIMFAFDPFAIVLILSGSISLSEVSIGRKKKVVPIVEHKHVIQKVPESTTPEITDDLSDKQAILGILHRNPHVIEELLDTVIEYHDKDTNNSKS